jgi:hypothetical protein
MTLRCWQVIDDTLYVVLDDLLLSVSAAGVVTERGALLTTGPRAWMDYNQFHLCLTDESYGYTYHLTTQSFQRIADFPAGRGMAFATGFLLSAGVGDGADSTRCYASGVFDAQTWDALAFGSVESSPDRLLLPVALKDSIVMYGEASIEVWSYNGDGSAFPFAYLPGTALNYGLAAVESVTTFRGSKAALLRAGNHLLVGLLSGYEVVSLTDKQRAVPAEWQTYARVDDAIGTAYDVGGFSIYQLTFPTAGKTWAYEGNTGIWVRLETDDGPFLGEKAIAWQGETWMADHEGALYRLDSESVRDGGYYLSTTLISNRLSGLSQFAVVSKVFLDAEVGTTPVIEGAGYDPTLTLYLSPDGGKTYKPGRAIRLGEQGEYLTRPTVRRLGRAKDIVIKVVGGGVTAARPIRHAISSASEVEIS